MQFNTQCENTKQQLLATINNSGLPIAPIYYMLGEIYREAEKSYYAALNQEAQMEEEKVEEVEANE